MARVAHGGGTAGWAPPRGRTTTRPNPAADRLGATIRGRVDASRRELGDELAVIDALVRMGQLEAAAHAVEDRRRAIAGLRLDLEELVGGAIGDEPSEHAADARHRSPAPTLGTLRPPSGVRLRLAVGLAAVFAGLALVMPMLSQTPIGAFGGSPASQATPAERQVAWAVFHEARQRLAAYQPTAANATEVTTEARELHDRILALSDAELADEQVRLEIQYLLVEQSGALSSLGDNPEAEGLLADVRALSASLGLSLAADELPPLPSEPLPLPSDEPVPPAAEQPAEPPAPAPAPQPEPQPEPYAEGADAPGLPGEPEAPAAPGGLDLDAPLGP